MEHAFHNNQKCTLNWEQRTPVSQIVFEAQTMTDSPGCEHLSSGCLLVCRSCSRPHGCRFCHDLEEDHKFVPGGIVCSSCGSSCEENHCECGNQLYKFSCQICNLFSLTELPPHCFKCGSCHYSSCPGLEPCACCLEPQNASLKPLKHTNCGHIVHEACSQLLDSFQCPVCKAAMLSGSEKAELLEDVVQRNDGLLCPILFQVHRCLDCHGEFVYPDFGIAICPGCRFFNTEQRGQASHEEYVMGCKKSEIVQLRKPTGLGRALEMLPYTQRRDFVEEMLVEDLTEQRLHEIFDFINLHVYGRDGYDEEDCGEFDDEEEDEVS